MVVPNLMKGFDIDEIQAEYVAEIKLRNINKQYILRRIEEVDQLKKDIEDIPVTNPLVLAAAKRAMSRKA